MIFSFKNVYKIYRIKKDLNKIIKLLPIAQKKIIYQYIKNVSSKYELDELKDILFLATLLSHVNYTRITNNNQKKEFQVELFKQLQIRFIDKNISHIKIIYLDESFKFGNTLILLNNLLYYAEVLNINNIYLNSRMNWPIKRNITIENINIKFVSSSDLNFEDERIICFNPYSVYSQKVIRPEIRINKIKDEIFKNLPVVSIDSDDLYIHIRGGDIFQCKACKDKNYSQPPLCFYQKILNNFKFKNIYILSTDKINPIISPLINEFPQIIYTQNLIQTDIAILSNAFNVVGSMSSFLTTLILINTNLENFWEFNNQRLTEKYLHLHPQIYQKEIKYYIYEMDASKNYVNQMFPWKNNKAQIYLMLKDKCSDFNVIYPSNYDFI